ncbi:MAG: glutamate--tRNA ligase [Sphingomonadaceae bacterium]|uniref:glutamate--tRNA ligase n=1 Tax=Thermaurantiacus sp. TaxID=2820283 RepID=UPI00298EFF83|nr:glutamate--tRNA ligase [Thermaurantiacus sp.]MCS6987412.1 glutamate--tRNA ligase [Sphingomonadaceae bacterium]MDW8415332.1 glutamate--tRNA ligase [Thermaurantiacus sp.]
MVTTRFAPSPTGRLHVGNLRTALLNWLFAKRHGGRFLLRLDDTDPTRCRAEFATAIEDDLAWLGLVPDARFRQSDRLDRYEAALHRLAAQGRTYRCWETPEELELKRRLQLSRGQPPVYDRAALALSEADHARFAAQGRRPHWRFLLKADDPHEWVDLIRGPTRIDPGSVSDPVIRREDGSWLYMLPSVVDDIEFGVTHVIRGEDHVTNTGVQLQIFAALGATPPAFAHAPLLTAADGKLSKRLGSMSVDEFRARGFEPMAIKALLARIGTRHAVEPVCDDAALIEAFDLADLGRAQPRFDEAELAALNARIVHQLPYAAVRDRVPLLEAEWLAVRGNLTTVAEAEAWVPVLRGEVPPPALGPEAEVARAAAELIEDVERLGPESWAELTRRLAERTGRRGRALFRPLRLALTGRESGPDMAALLPLIGRERALARLRRAAA